MKKVITLLLSLALVVGMVGCGGNDSGAQNADDAASTEESSEAAEESGEAAEDASAPAEASSEAADGAVYTIGLVAMLTGDNALNGERMRNAAEMAVSQYNEKAGYEKFTLVVEDDQMSQEGALTAVQKLISDGVLAIVGPHRSSNALAVSDTAESNGIATLVGGTSVAIDGSNPYLFRTRASDAIMASVAAEYCKEVKNSQNVGIIHASDEYGQGGADAAMTFFDANGIAYVDQPHNVGDVDFQSAILACQNAGVDTIFLWTHDTEMAIVAQQLNTYLPDVDVVCSPGATLDNVLNLCEDEWVDGWSSVTDFIPTSTDAVPAAFISEYSGIYNETPDLYAAAYYGGACTVLDAILSAEAGGEVNRETVAQAIRDMDQVERPTGMFYCDDKNDLVHSCMMAVLEGKSPNFYGSYGG